MGMKILPFGNAEPSRAIFDNGNVAMLVYVVGDDGGPSSGGYGFGSGANSAGSSGFTYVPAAGGIVDTAAVTIAPAVAGKTNTLRQLSIQNGSATATEVTINNGAGGPVVWRGYAGANSTITATPNASASQGALLEVQAGTTGSKLYVNASGTVA